MNHPTRRLSAHRKAHSPSPFPISIQDQVSYLTVGAALRAIGIGASQ